jgi:hypothetical protein
MPLDPTVPGLTGQPHAERPAGALGSFTRWVQLGLAAICGLALLLRCAAIAEPLGIDQSLWASAVRGMARGQLLYRDVWEQRPPGIYWIYLAGFRTLGWSSATVAWLDILAFLLTTVALWATARRLGGPVMGAATGALYAALTMPAWLFRYGGFLERSVSETFIAACVAVSAWCGAIVLQRRSLPAAAGLGLSAGAAIVLKPNAGLYLPALLVWILACWRPQAPPSRGAAAPLAVALAGTAVLPLIALAWLWRLGLLHEARVAVVDFNRFYVSEGFSAGGYALAFARAVWLRVKTDPLWLAGAAASCVAAWQFARARRLPPVAALAIVWGAAAALVIVVNGARLYNTYFLQVYPPLAILAAWLLTGAPAPGWVPSDGARRKRGGQVAAAVTAIGMAVLLLQRSYAGKVFGWARADLDVLRGRSEQAAYLERFGGYANNRGYSARANAELAAYVHHRTAPDDRIFLFGINGAGVYFAADRLAAHRFLRVNFFVETGFPDPRFRLGPVTRELAAARPRYIIFEQLHSRSAMGAAADSLPHQPDVVALLAAYRLETRIEDFTLFRLRD